MSTRVALTMHGSAFKNIHFVAKQILKLNNRINTYLIRLNIISYYSLSLNTCECLICHFNRLKTDPQFHLKILL